MGGGEVDGNGLAGVAEAGIHEGGFDAFAAFAHCGVRHADEHEIAGHAAAVQVHFDINGMRVDAGESGRAGLEQRHGTGISCLSEGYSRESSGGGARNFSGRFQTRATKLKAVV